MAEAVYILCFLTSAVATWLLFRSYERGRSRLLLWAGLGFAGLSLNNLLLFVDVVIVPQTDLSVVRSLPALLGMAVMIYGLIWEGQR